MELTRIKSFHPDQMGPLFLGGNLPGETAGPARVPAIVIAGTHQGPAGMGLAFDVGGGSIVLRVQRVELLVEPMLGRDPRIDRTADRSDGWSPHQLDRFQYEPGKHLLTLSSSQFDPTE